VPGSLSVEVFLVDCFIKIFNLNYMGNREITEFYPTGKAVYKQLSKSLKHMLAYIIKNKWGCKMKLRFFAVLLLMVCFLVLLSCEKEPTSSEDDKTGTVTDIDGNLYQTVKIGNQWWMAENLKVTHYRNGDVIPNVTDDTEWSNLTTGAYCEYDSNNSNIETYGCLYNWYAIDDNRNIAPAGWHIPTDQEWKELEIYMGISQSVADSEGLRGANEASKLAGNANLWLPGNLTNDAEFGTSSFNALPGGLCLFNGFCGHMRRTGSFWSSTEYDSNNAWCRTISYNCSEIERYYYSRQDGFSVRCIRD
jgi:uncharacterized protein (TIGR02145 family)